MYLCRPGIEPRVTLRSAVVSLHDFVYRLYIL